jgi:hypothetical protein
MILICDGERWGETGDGIDAGPRGVTDLVTAT